jgi:hypothetical protein
MEATNGHLVGFLHIPAPARQPVPDGCINKVWSFLQEVIVLAHGTISYCQGNNMADVQVGFGGIPSSPRCMAWG